MCSVSRGPAVICIRLILHGRGSYGGGFYCVQTAETTEEGGERRGMMRTMQGYEMHSGSRGTKLIYIRPG